MNINRFIVHRSAGGVQAPPLLTRTDEKLLIKFIEILRATFQLYGCFFAKFKVQLFKTKRTRRSVSAKDRQFIKIKRAVLDSRRVQWLSGKVVTNK
jgi:hypothetical protein